ncbi:RAMP superfamily CRISPR-associated protein [uncultured Actinomyces sp.]|uniref:RAMP superfamily CRISPR-associated protein n=1 Tax=uncultured Actinomyces sp. TaxID=249061 RepID=UPI00288915F7|nr:RAMP superfamily CRISPR-associated protein [uncultured Actinomyces sp.]
MSTTDSAAESEKSLGVTIVFRSDWGVSTGTGVAGGVDVVVEKDKRDLPVVRGTVLTGAIREQAFVVAEALDADSPDKNWREFVGALFGSVKRARLVSFSDACFSSFSDGSIPSDNESRREAVHEVVSLSIDEETGTAKKDHLRLFERARACILRGTVDLLDRTLDGRPLCWSKEQREAAELVLTVSALLVRALGSNRSDGDGLCNILIGETGEIDKRDANPEQVIENAIGQARERCRGRLEQWDGPAPDVPSAPDAPIDSKTGGCSGIPVIRKKNHDHRGGSDGTSFYQADFDIRLTTPVISYDVPFSNELRSLDFLRGTALLPIIHHRLQDVSKEDAAVCEIVRDAVVNGDLLVSDATAVVGDRVGLPMPLVLSTPKVSRAGREWIEVANRLLVEEPKEIHKPLRSEYLFPASKSADSSEVRGRMGAPALQGRQSTAHNPVTGAAGTGQLFLARALPAGMHLRATVTMSTHLHEQIKDKLKRAFPPNFPERLGLWRLSGTYGRAKCRLGDFRPVEVLAPKWDEDGATTLWFTSDVVVRSPGLGPGGSLGDLCNTFKRAGVPLELAEDPDEMRFSAGIRHRRVDSWGAADRRPRATRTVIQAGSVLRVRPADGSRGPEQTMKRLARLSVTGVGELTAQGLGRFVVNHLLLREEEFRLIPLNHADFVAGECATVKSEEE